MLSAFVIALAAAGLLAPAAKAGDGDDFSREAAEARRDQMREERERIKDQMREERDRRRADREQLKELQRDTTTRDEAEQRQEELRREFERIREGRRQEWEKKRLEIGRGDGKGWDTTVDTGSDRPDRGPGNSGDSKGHGLDTAGGKPDDTAAKDDSDKKNSGKPDKSKGAADVDKDDGELDASQPPKTLADAVKRIVKKSLPATDLRASKDFNSFRPSEIIATNLDDASLKRALRHNFRSGSETMLSGLGVKVHKLIAPPGMDTHEALRLLNRDAPGAQVSLNHVYQIYNAADGHAEGGTPASPARPAAALLPGLPGQQNVVRGGCTGEHCFGPTLINWKPSLASCAAPVKIGIIDTSFDLSHPSLRDGKYFSGYFADGNTPSKFDWHGTAVLALLAGRPKSAAPGLIPEASFFLATAFRTDERGNAATDTMSLVKALDWLDKMGVNVINMSFSGPRDALVEQAITGLGAKGVVMVAAAGNNGPAAPFSYPAAYDGVIAVTAVSKSLTGYRHANRGSYIDMAAPGVDVWTALPDGSTGARTGTSLAAPFATGVISARLGSWKGPRDKSTLLSKLAFKDLGNSGRDATYGEGLLLAADSCAGYDATVAQKAKPLPQPMAVGAWEAVTH